MLEHSEQQCSRTCSPGVGQTSMCTGVPCLCASPGTSGCPEQHISSAFSREQQPKHQGWQPGQATGRGSNAPWIHPSPGFPLRAQGTAFPALITALGLSRIVLSIFKLWMLPWMCPWQQAGILICISPEQLLRGQTRSLQEAQAEIPAQGRSLSSNQIKPSLHSRTID